MNPMTKAGEQPTITQADRDALADYYSIEGIGEYKNSVAERVRQGLHEDPLLDAFARHRAASLAAPVDTLFDAIKHGDDAHKAWLKEAIECHFSGKPIPPARGKGTTSLAAQEPVAMRYDFDGYGWKYIDSGSGSDWQTRYPDAEPLYSSLAAQDGLDDELRNALAAAYVAGATDVHSHWAEGDADNNMDPDFGEAGWDYAHSIDVAATKGDKS